MQSVKSAKYWQSLVRQIVPVLSECWDRGDSLYQIGKSFGVRLPTKITTHWVVNTNLCYPQATFSWNVLKLTFEWQLNFALYLTSEVSKPIFYIFPMRCTDQLRKSFFDFFFRVWPCPIDTSSVAPLFRASHVCDVCVSLRSPEK